MNAINPLASAVVAQSRSFTNDAAAPKFTASAPAALVEISSQARQLASAGSVHSSSNIIWGSAPSR